MSVGRVSVFGCGGVGGVGRWLGTGSGLVVWCYVCVSCEARLFVYMAGPASVYCARRFPAQLRCTRCSILLHLINICFLPCIYLWQISQIQTSLCVVVRPVFVSTSPAFMGSSASHTAGPHCWLSPKTVNRAPIDEGGRLRHHFHGGL